VRPVTSATLTTAASIDEVLSEDFESLPRRSSDADLGAKRLAAWCRSAAGGDWSLFGLRLARDEIAIDWASARLSAARRRPDAEEPQWARDSAWIAAALDGWCDVVPGGPRHPFDDLMLPVVREAEARLWSGVGSEGGGASDHRLTPAARGSLRQMLTRHLSELLAPALYPGFAAAPDYRQFIDAMRSSGLQHFFEEYPVARRLVAVVTRQWLDTSREFLTRLEADLPALRAQLLGGPADTRVTRIRDGLSDPHHGGRSVLDVEFDGGLRLLYKPKDLRVDAAWEVMVDRLNADAPVRLLAARTVARDGYGWAEFIEHTGCGDQSGISRYFQRAGALLALLHGFAAADIHQENLIAHGEHPVPVDLETVLQPEIGDDGVPPGSLAHHAARAVIADSVLAVGLLPGHGRGIGDRVHAVGGIAPDWTGGPALTWEGVNTDAMRPVIAEAARTPTTNLPHIGGVYAGLADNLEDFLHGYRCYADYLSTRNADRMLADFAGLPVRKVLRPTQFYALLLRRLKSPRTFGDAVLWSVQADFLARLSNWDDADPLWELQRAERAALLDLTVPRFVMHSDGAEISDGSGCRVATTMTTGVGRARARLRGLGPDEIAWQCELIRQSTIFADVSYRGTDDRPLAAGAKSDASTAELAAARADAIAAEIAGYAIRDGRGAAWIGSAWFADADVAQLAVMGDDLYNGTSGVAVFLAAHARATGSRESADLALAAVAHLRAQLGNRNPAHLARVLGIGGAVGLGSLVYALTVMSTLLEDASLGADARRAAALITDELVTADRRLDVIGGSAGAVLCLLRLHRDTGAEEDLAAAVHCGEHLLATGRIGPPGQRSWPGNGRPAVALTGMAHGAAGFAYALAALATASGRAEFADAARECVEFERLDYDAARGDWRDRRQAGAHRRSQWCHGAVGIGLARLAMGRHHPFVGEVSADVDRAVAVAMRSWPGHVDTLCCGTLGNIELLREAAALERPELGVSASDRLRAVLDHERTVGDVRWNAGARRFNLGLFRGLAGVGYTCLREFDRSLPNVLIWQ